MRVFHVARNPMTGVWSVIKTFLRCQGEDASEPPGLFVLASKSWPHRDEARSLTKQYIELSTPEVAGTLAFGLHAFDFRIEGIVKKLLESTIGRRPLVLHYHNAWLSGCLARKYPKGEVVQIATFHGLAGEAALRRQPVRRLLHRSYASRLEKFDVRCATVAGQNISAFSEVLSLNPKSFTIVPNGISPSAKLSPPWTGQRPFIVGHVGIMNGDKGWRYTAEAVELSRQRGLDVKLVMAGGGPDASTAAAWCKARFGWASFLGQVTDAGIVVTPTLDLLVLPSSNEGLPMAILEAFSAGVPVAATPVGGIPEVVDHNVNGLIIERSAKSVAAAIHWCHSNISHFNQMKQAAFNKANTAFSAATILQTYDHLYRQALL